ncbi:MAG: metal-dependent transcriptional regulator [Spirochaetota bacterium]
MVTSTVEQYIKVLFSESERAGGETVSMKTVSESMQVTPGTATSMVKHLASLELVEYIPRRGCRLTSSGANLGIRMVRRHRLLETFLERMLGYDWSEVHAEAEQLEHVVSDMFIDRIDALLEFPESDPHGDPIPPADNGPATGGYTVPLSQAPSHRMLRVVRVLGNNAGFLNLLKRLELMPGTLCIMVGRDSAAGTLTLRHAGGQGEDMLLSDEAAAGIHVVVSE